MRPNPLSTKEIHGLSVFYAGIGMFVGTFVGFIHPLTTFGGGAIIALLGMYIFVTGRDARFDAAKHIKRQA